MKLARSNGIIHKVGIFLRHPDWLRKTYYLRKKEGFFRQGSYD
jgi:hypothetical protein